MKSPKIKAKYLVGKDHTLTERNFSLFFFFIEYCGSLSRDKQLSVDWFLN